MKVKYHALQINLQKRFSDGLSATASYVWSKLMDTSGVGNGAAFLDPSSVQDIYNYKRGEYSLSTLDVPHRFVGSFSYELPFGRGKRFGRDLNGVCQRFRRRVSNRGNGDNSIGNADFDYRQRLLPA